MLASLEGEEAEVAPLPWTFSRRDCRCTCFALAAASSAMLRTGRVTLAAAVEAAAGALPAGDFAAGAGGAGGASGALGAAVGGSLGAWLMEGWVNSS